MTQAEFQERYVYDPSSDCLGRGGFGAVYRAHDTLRGREVAIKVSEVRDERFRLKHEVDIAKSLPEHRNIAHYEECHTISTLSGAFDFAIMQYYKAGSLEHLLTHESLTVEQRYDILRQLLEGIAFLHSHNIIHRDLKPQNILIDKYRGKITLKITDFGISKHLNDNANSVVTNSLMGVGTLSYASPEQLSSKNIRHNTDLWSFGVLAFRVLTNTLPFTSGQYTADSEDGRNEIIRQIKTGVLPSAIYSISEPWCDIIKRCLTTDNTLRIQTAKECISLLDGNIYREELPNHEEETIKSIEPVIETPIVEKEVVKVKPRRRKKETKETTPVIPYIKTRYDKIFDWIYIIACWGYTTIVAIFTIDFFISAGDWYFWPTLAVIINIVCSFIINLHCIGKNTFNAHLPGVWVSLFVIFILVVWDFLSDTRDIVTTYATCLGLFVVISNIAWLKHVVKWEKRDKDSFGLSRAVKLGFTLPLVLCIASIIYASFYYGIPFLNATYTLVGTIVIPFNVLISIVSEDKDERIMLPTFGIIYTLIATIVAVIIDEYPYNILIPLVLAVYFIIPTYNLIKWIIKSTYKWLYNAISSKIYNR